MNEGAVQHETGRNTVAYLRQLRNTNRAIRNQLATLVRNNQVRIGASGVGSATLYESDAEPPVPNEIAWWYKPATGGTGGQLYACMQKGNGDWAWVYINGAPAS